MTLPDPTVEQKAAAVTTAGQSVALTSGAGCGKTFVLARRFIELVLQSNAEGNPFDGLVALTFTDKASLEMSSRVRGVLLERLAQSHGVADRQKLADWIAQLPAARISTIHSFCSSLLRRYAVEAGIDPNFHVFPDELLSEPMKQQAAQEAILDAVEAGGADVADLLAYQEMPTLVRDVVTLIQHPLDWTEAEYADPAATLARWREKQREALAAQAERFQNDPALRAEVTFLAEQVCTDPTDKLEQVRQAALAEVGEFCLASSGGETSFAPPAKPGNLGRAAAWGGKENMLAFRRRLAAFIDVLRALAVYTQTPGPADEQAARALAGLTVLAAAAHRRYGAAKRRQGLLDFDDLIVLSSRLLTQDAGVREELRQSLRQLLVDECQDTDSQQLAMLWNLLCDDDAPVPPGKLFVVGDPKQSIYRFRGAQAEVFGRLCERFERHLSLTESFRTHAAGVALVNTIFGRIMPNYEPIQSRRLERPEGPSAEFLLAACPEGAGAAEASQAQASVVAQRIAAMLGGERRVWDREDRAWRPARPGDIAILFARMTNTLDYERALQQWGVPYYVVAGIGFFRQQEVYDLLNALRAIDNPCDDVAVVGVLRGGMLGLDDNALLHLAGAGKGTYFQRLCDGAALDSLPARYRSRFAQAGQLLQRLHRQKDALGPDGLIESLLDETGFAAALLGQYQGRRRLGNVYQVLDKARAARGSGLLTLHDFIESFSGLVLSNPRYEQSAVAGQEDDVVRIMTIHKAKGLEWPVVFVPDLNAPRRDKSGGLIFRPDWGVTYRGGREDADDQERSECLSYRLSRELEKRDLAAEDVRKLYVAMTRHEDYLVLAGADTGNADGEFAKDSYLAALDEGLGGQLSAAIGAGADTLNSGQGWQMALTRLEPRDGPGSKAAPSAAAKLLAEAADGDALAAGVGGLAARADLPLAGAIPAAATTGGGMLAATALGDFVCCPMLFHWQHELRLHPARPAKAGGSSAPAALPAAMLGTFLHRCMELLDFSGPWPDEAARTALAARVRAEQELTAPLDELAGELAAALAVLEGNPLRRELASARCRLSELHFVSRQVGVTIAGQIDLLFEDAAGAWHIIDYKSDRVGPEGLAAHASRYELQMMLYVQAAQRHLAALRPGAFAVDARLYFLRTGAVHRFEWAGRPPESLGRQLANVAAQLAASRRSGQYPRHAGEGCRFCPYQGLCHR